ncbi:hypothetical protein AMTRI_Chr11g97630 [Amborella trichopoda]
MEDIEDVIGSGAPPGLRFPMIAVGMKLKKLQSRKMEDIPSLNIPGTQVKTLICIFLCTVKSPSQSAMETLILKSKSARKPLVVAGCVPQGSKDLKELEGVSIIGVQQIDRVVEVVEETLKGHEVRLLKRSTLPALDLPKVRKNRFVEILPINVGCLGACTYCKTKHARGHLGSYTVESLVNRVRQVISGGVKEIWLSSEDTGAYGRDIGVNLPILLNAIVAELPPDRSTILRIGMTNPPFILEHLNEIAKVLCHPCVYSFLHVPVQSGSDFVLKAMNREYTVGEFKVVVDTLNQLVPGMQIATDIICGFPGETDEDFAETIKLIQEYRFPHVHISQFYPRPGTPAARMKKVPSRTVKNRSRELTSVFESFTPYHGMEGRIEKIWITETATDGIYLVGHTKGYIQVLVVAPKSMLGTSTYVKITSVGRWSVFGDVIEIPDDNICGGGDVLMGDSAIFGLSKDGSCSIEETECYACDCEERCNDMDTHKVSTNITNQEDRRINGGSSNYYSSMKHGVSLRWLISRKQKNWLGSKDGRTSGAGEKEEVSRELARFSYIDWALMGVMVLSFACAMISAILYFFIVNSS